MEPFVRRIAPWMLLLVAVGCGKAPALETTVTPEADGPKAVEHARVEARATEPCATARCWVQLAEQRREAGAGDAAAAYLGRAHAVEPTEASLRAWLEALAATGQRRRLARALAEARAEHPELVAALQAEAAAAGRDRTVAVGEPSATVRTALVAELDGRIDEAIAGLRTSTEPADRARLGDLAWQRGDRAAARRAWAEARIELDERGGRMRMIPIERWYAEGMLWSGDRLVLVRGWRPLDPTDPVLATELQHWSPGESAELLRSVVLPGDAGMVALSRDGERLLGTSSGGLDVIELATGRPMARWPLRGSKRAGALATAGEGSRALVLVGAASGAELVSADGEIVDRFELRGTTPMLTRVYGTIGDASHEEVLEDSPTWPVSAAISGDGRWVAIGGSDSKVRLYDRERGSMRELARGWDHVEQRPVGGSAALDLPLDVRLVSDDRELLVAYRHGDVIAWRTSDGKRLRTIRGTCSPAEATTEANRFVSQGTPRRAPTAEEREACGHASTARFSPDASLVATVGNGVRVRDTITGASVAMLVEPELPSDMLAFAPDGRLAIADVQGRPRVWSREGGTTAPWGRGEASPGPIAPRLDGHGRYLALDLRDRWVVWDLEEGRDVSPVQRRGERTLAVAPDGAWIVAAARGGVELRRRDGTVEWSREASDATADFIAGGKVVLAQQGEVRVRELESGREVVLPDASPGRRHAESADGNRLALFDDGGPLRIYDTERGTLVLALDVKARHAVMAPDGSWIAWLEVSGDRETETLACWRRLDDSEDRVLRIPISGRAKTLAVAPDAGELLAATETAIVRWHPQEGWQRAIEGLGYVGANEIRYSADGRRLLFEGHDRIDVRENADGLALLGSLLPLPDGGWAATSEDGALDGSETAPQHMMTLVEGPHGDVLLHGGTLGWDRFEVQGLWGQLLEGKRVQPAIEPAPRSAP